MTVDISQFNNPSSQFRGAPFWALNHDLTDHDRLKEHIDAFEDMGMGGYHLHVRPGLKTPYLGEDYMEAIHACRNYGKEKGLLSYLYDEDTWPSGFAGGLVTQSLEFRQRLLSIKQGPQPESTYRTLLKVYRITFNSEGQLDTYAAIDAEQATSEDWHVYRYIQEDNDRYNGEAYLDVLNPKAVRRFIDCTYEPMRQTFGGTFPDDVPAIFTDEPQFHGIIELEQPTQGRAELAYTDDFPDTFEAAYGIPFWDILPEIIWHTKTGPSPNRWRYWDHVSERFATAYNDQIGTWCETYNIDFTGHVNGEDSLYSQMSNTGEAMRHYRSYSIPGIDVLCDYYHLHTAKQAVSMARQDGRKGVMSELYGVTNWDFDFKGHKRQGDWQAALGITLRVPHLSWLSMEGQSKRDYPAAIGIQSPWYKEYKLIEDHFSRVNVALTQGNAIVRIGVIHGIESAWMHRGVLSHDQDAFHVSEAAFQDCNAWLTDGQLDFDLLCESELPRQYSPSEDGKLHIGNMAYDVIVLPNLKGLRHTTLDALRQHLDKGGSVIVTGDIPYYINGTPSQSIKDTLSGAQFIAHTPKSLVAALEPWREFDVMNSAKNRCSPINYQLRQVGDERVLFCSQRELTSKTTQPFIRVPEPQGDIRLKGYWQVRELNTFTGEEQDCAYHQVSGETVIPWMVHDHSHRLLRLIPGSGEHQAPDKRWAPCGNLAEPTAVSLEEDNVLLLDQAEYRVDNEPWQTRMDTTMAQRKLAERFGWPDWVQPYYVKDRGPKHTITRRYTIHAETDIPPSRLMCERLDQAIIRLNDQVLDVKATDYWVDRDLPTGAFPALPAGDHVLEIELWHDKIDRHLEWVYLLGDFDVTIRGAHAFISTHRMPQFWGDTVTQGMPFYGGNVDYTTSITIEDDGEYALRIPSIGGSLCRIWLNDTDLGPVAFTPNRMELGSLATGTHTIKIRCYGNRHNSFGALHNQAHGWNWYGPPAWRVEHEHQNDIWQLKPTGITRAPLLESRIE